MFFILGLSANICGVVVDFDVCHRPQLRFPFLCGSFRKGSLVLGDIFTASGIEAGFGFYHRPDAAMFVF